MSNPIINACHECYFCNIIADKIVPYRKTFKCRRFNEVLMRLTPCIYAVPKNRSDVDGKERNQESIQRLFADNKSV